MRNQIFAAVAMALLGACVGGIDTTTPPASGDDDTQTPTTAKDQFVQTVQPILAMRCQACHVGPETSTTNMFLGPDGPSSFYDTLVADRAVNGGFDPAAATILLKGAHEGPALLPTEATAITSWLQAELTARGAQTPPATGNGNKNPRTAEMAFAACMSVSMTEYTTTQAYQVANMNTGQGRCSSCHSPGGAGGQWLGTSPVVNNAATYTDMLAKWQQEVFFTGVFQAQLQTDGTYKIAAADTKICNKGKEKANNLGTHPPFDCAQNNSTALNNLKLFATQVQAKVDAGGTACPAPAFGVPTP
jgi:putative hemolysin